MPMLHIQDAEWTKDETDYLFSLMREYDGRFFVVHDRYEYPNGPERTIEVRDRSCPVDWLNCHSILFQDLKDRYFSVCRKLVRSRPWPGDDASKQALISTLTYDKCK